MTSAMECGDGYQRPKVGCVNSDNPRHINMPARLYDVLSWDLEAALALAHADAKVTDTNHELCRCLNQSMLYELKSYFPHPRVKFL
jgi:hypothetical protein